MLSFHSSRTVTRTWYLRRCCETDFWFQGYLFDYEMDSGPYVATAPVGLCVLILLSLYLKHIKQLEEKMENFFKDMEWEIALSLPSLALFSSPRAPWYQNCPLCLDIGLGFLRLWQCARNNDLKGKRGLLWIIASFRGCLAVWWHSLSG